MPHIVVKMHKGRTEQQKLEMCDAITAALVNTIKCSEDHISIAIVDYNKETWGEEVFYPEIMANEQKLYKKPNYKPE